MARASRMKIGCSPPPSRSFRSSATCHWAMV
jgi:hypothetical protein